MEVQVIAVRNVEDEEGNIRLIQGSEYILVDDDGYDFLIIDELGQPTWINKNNFKEQE